MQDNYDVEPQGPDPAGNPEQCTCASLPAPKSATAVHPLSNLKHDSNYKAALKLSSFGLTIIPVVPGNKHPAVPWDPWIKKLSPSSIRAHWSHNPDHELGCIVSNLLIVFDADSPSAVAALHSIEARLGIQPALAVGTRRGEHHYFRRPIDVLAKSDSHCTEKHPERIDIKTGRAMVVLPPSTGKTVLNCTVSHVSELTEVTQEFVDAVYVQNGRPPPRPRQAFEAVAQDELPHGPSLNLVAALIVCLDPDLGYDDWLRTGIVIFNETKGSDEGFRLWDDWSSRGKKYKGVDEISKKWASFNLDHPHPLRLGTLIRMVNEAGHDAQAILAEAEPQFSVVADEGGEQ